MTAERAEQRRFKMIFTIDTENNISVFGAQEEATATITTAFEFFTSSKELAQLASTWPAERLVAIWNSLVGVKPVTTFKFKTAKAGATKIWESAHPRRARQSRKRPQPRTRPKPRRPLRKRKVLAREGSKTAQVVALLQRKTAPRWPRSWTRWVGKSTPSAGSCPAR